jgi:hypothetical protein
MNPPQSEHAFWTQCAALTDLDVWPPDIADLDLRRPTLLRIMAVAGTSKDFWQNNTYTAVGLLRMYGPDAETVVRGVF